MAKIDGVGFASYPAVDYLPDAVATTRMFAQELVTRMESLRHMEGELIKSEFGRRLERGLLGQNVACICIISLKSELRNSEYRAGKHCGNTAENLMSLMTERTNKELLGSSSQLKYKVKQKGCWSPF